MFGNNFQNDVQCRNKTSTNRTPPPTFLFADLTGVLDVFVSVLVLSLILRSVPFF